MKCIFTKRVIATLFTAHLLVFSNASAVQVFPGEGLTFYQLDLTYPGATQLNSRYGMVVAHFDTLVAATGIGIGYLNIVTSQGWVVRNMPVDTSSGYPGLTTIFDLGDTVNIGDLLLYADLSVTPSPTFSAIPNTTFGVGAKEYNAQGRGSMLTSPPYEPIEVDSLIFDPLGLIDAIWQFFFPNVEQDENQCAPASVANSLQWLENMGHIEVTHEHEPGIRDNSLVGELDKDMNRQPHQTVDDPDALGGKLRYISDNDLGDDLVCKHKNRPGTDFVPNEDTTVGNVTSKANTDPNQSLIDWVIAEVKAGEDVELGIGWDGGGGHWVRVTGGGHILGVPWIAFLHDARQGYDDMGTPDVNDDETDINGGTSFLEGGLGLAFVANDRFISWIGNGTVDLAFSESPRGIVDNIDSLQGLTFTWYQDGVMMEVEWYYTYRVDGGAAIGESEFGRLDFRATHPEHDGKSVQFNFFRPPGQNGWRQTIFSYSSGGVSDVYTVGDYPGEWHIPDIAALLGSACGDTIFTAVDMNLYGASNPDGFGEPGGSVGKNLSGLGVIIVDGQVEGLEGIYWASSEWTLDTTGRSIFKPIGGIGTLLNSADCPDDLMVVAEHVGGILEGGTTCCSGTRGNVDGDADESVNIVDLTFLVSYLFDGGSPPPCWEEADIDGDDSVNVADVTSLVEYIFFSGPAPLSCP